MYDIAIIGAGVVGGMLARTLAAYNLKTVLLEKEHDVAMGATKANSAIVHAGFDAKIGSLKAKLNVLGSNMMENVAKELGVRYKKNGSLVIGFDENDKKTIEELFERGNENGVKNLKILDRKEILAIEPNIGDGVICALHAPTGAIICPYDLAIAAIGNAMDNGVELKLDFCVKAIEKTENRYKICSNDGFIDAKYVVNCAGVFSDDIAKAVGDNSFDVHARRGEYILLDKECGSLVSHTIFRTPSKMGKGILVSPTVDGNLLLGPTSVDIDEKADKSTHSKDFEQIISQANENVKSIPFGKAITSFCGLRAVGSTGDFIINSPKENFINAAGIESPGLSASPAIAKYIVDMLENMGLTLEKNPKFNPIRRSSHAFSDASIDEKNEIIKKDASFGKIVCRCEKITEGEILDAIRRNPKARDLDGVKRRTRAQMGRCQGGFCGPYITELLAKELNIPFESVTKFGGESYINVGKTKEGI